MTVFFPCHASPCHGLEPTRRVEEAAPAGPGLGEAAGDCIQDGSTVKLAEGPQDVDGFQWWRLEDRDGWVAADWLRYPDAAQ